MGDVLLTPAQVAERLQVSPFTVMGWLRRGKLKGLKAGKFWRIAEEDLKGFLEGRVPEAHQDDGEAGRRALADLERIPYEQVHPELGL